MIVIMINTFNTQCYLDSSKTLLEKMKSQLSCIPNLEVNYIKVCGGCEENLLISTENTFNINITENLSDHNGYVGFSRYVSTFCTNKFINATYVYLHDTCVLSPQFGKCIKNLDNFVFHKSAQWVFAHTYGLYNIGICTFDFIVHRSNDFKTITYLPKHLSVVLEQGTPIVLNNKQIPSLLNYSIYTLTNMINNTNNNIEENIDSMDTYSINGIQKNEENIRWICYIASLGIYKPFTSNFNFLVPIWCNTLDYPQNLKEYYDMKKHSINDLKTGFVPLIYYHSTFTF